ncbi:hypothetical protein [Catenuloplanes indicus]|uniref:Uncharacterized protein n=1 Tax=Catenuloplanes indicus TaxID=137267 RepID=A0AAE3W150_9ACTN|nr:hypothetical protein [Catenuloplanes indicus]MDQ0366854.1 hypothetical protein [Catenuloplanes indicus]
MADESFSLDELGRPQGIGTYMVRAFFTFGFKEWVGGIPVESWTAELDVPESMLAGLHAKVNTIVSRQAQGHVYREVRGRTSWGADSGEFIRVVLFVASSAASGIIGNAMYDLLKSLANTSSQSEPRPMDRDEAVERAKWILTSHFANDVESLDPMPLLDEELRLVAASQDKITGAWTVACRDVHGSQFVVQLGLDDLPMINKISWREAGPS